MPSDDRLDATTILLLILGAFALLPLLMMGLGFGGMMGYGGVMGQYGSTGGWWPFIGMLVPITFLLAIVGGGYLLFRRLGERETAQDPAIAELRTAYARGELTDEEFEARREKLEK